MSPRIIGLTGKKFAGKTTISDYICVKYGFREETFAGPLKKMLAIAFQTSESIFHDPLTKEVGNPDLFGRTPRSLMQFLGTDVFRKCVHPDIWVENMRRRLSRASNVDADIIVTDIRFDNEAEVVRQMGGQVWCIERGVGTKSNDVHESENGIDSSLIDKHVRNLGTIDELYMHVDQLMLGR